jgi:hypothetical protein
LDSSNMAAQSPLVGYNTNVRHKGKLYHIQTEDSGVSHPHVITHLFADGGRIIASRKTAYAEHLGAKDLANIVKKLMQDQHKAMFIELRDCVYDSEPPPASGPIETQPQVEPAVPAEAVQVTAANIAGNVAANVQAKPPLAATPIAKAARAASVAGIPAPLGRAAEAAVAAAAPPPVPAAVAFGQPPAKPLQVSTASQAALLGATAPLSSDDIETFERAAEARLLSSILGKARIEASRRGLGRYQQTVSAKPARAPRQPSRNIFGGEALRGKSLDEVILSYLSDDAGDTER